MIATEHVAALLRERLDQLGQPALLAVYLFGSAARDEARQDSDIDLAFLAERPCDAKSTFALAQELAARLGREVDLIDLARASTVMRAEVLRSGQRLFTGDQQRVDEFEMYALSDYARLNEERRDLLDRFLERYRG